MSNFIKIKTLKTSIFLFLLGLTFGLNAQISITFETSVPTCNGYGDGTTTATATGGTAPYTYNWANGQSGATNFGISDGSYTVNVSDATGQTNSASVTVTAPEELVSSITFGGDVCTSETGELTGNATGGTSPYSYSWSNGASSQTISGLPVGDYFLTTTDASGCQSVEFYGINGPLAVNVSTIDVVCNGFCDASAQATISGGIAPYSYIWNTGMTGSTAFPLPAGEFCVTVTDGNNCTISNCATVTEPEAVEISITLSGDCDGNSDISASIEVIGGVPAYIIEWSNDETGTSITNLEPNTTYSVTATDINGCRDTESITTGDLSQLSITASGENETCSGDNDGSATITPGGGVAPYTIVWSTGSNEETINDLTPGNYSVTITDANGCVGQQTVTVDAGTTISVSSETTASACGEDGTGSISLVPSGGMAPYFFLYENGIGEPTSGQVSDLTAGTYNVTVGDAQGCTTVTTVNVPQIAEFTVTASATAESCGGIADGTASVVSISAGAAQPVTYLWDNGSMEDSTVGLSAGPHEVTVTDANGCTAIETVIVEAGTPISADIVITPNDCTGDIISVNVSTTSMSDMDTYLYTTSNDETFITPDFILNIPAGETVTITLLVENAAGCTSESETTFTAESFEPTVPETFEACLGEDLTATATSGADDTYQWTSDDDIFIGATDIANPEINTSTAGNFPATVTITNPQGCSVTEAVTITVSDTEIMPDPALISSTQNCDGTLLDFTNTNASAGDYEWIFDYPEGETVPGGTAGSYEYPEVGIYNVAIIPTVGCADTVIIEVEVIEPQMADFTFETNCDDFVVVFTDMSSNPADITDWNWVIAGEMYNEQNPSVELDMAGTIDAVLTVSYGDDCVIETTQAVNVAPFMPVTPASQLVDCGGGNATDLFPNANTDYDYEWSPTGGLSDANVPNPTATVTETTTYTVTITDPETGCTEESEVTVTVPDALTGPILDDITLCQSENETADATVPGGVNYTWSDDEDFNNVLSEEAVYSFTVSEVETTYYVLIEDEFGCTTTESFTALADPIEFDFGSIKFPCEGDITTYNLPDGLIVDWGGDDPADTPIFEEDFFVGIVTDTTNSANCSLTDTLFAEAVIVTEGLEIMAEPDTILLGDVSELFVTPDDRFTYEWDNSETLNDSEIHDPTARPEETTIYTVTIRDGDGCEGELDVEVVVENNCEPFLYFPNAFTPDDDGLNDVLFVEGLSLDEVFFAIYNRWGEKVYESNDISEGWDGTHKGETVCPDVYGYYLRVRCTDGNEIFRKGNVSVLR